VDEPVEPTEGVAEDVGCGAERLRVGGLEVKRQYGGLRTARGLDGV
jgi:hypothetical protein